MKFFLLAVCLFLSFVPGLIGQAATLPEIKGWYAELAKPSWNPPNWIFAPVWTSLYILLGISLWLIILRGNAARSTYRLFALQLVCNALWSVIFFGMHMPAAALVDLVILWLLIGVLMLRFWKISRLAALLLAPYFTWVGFAGVLNFVIWQLNQ